MSLYSKKETKSGKKDFEQYEHRISTGTVATMLTSNHPSIARSSNGLGLKMTLGAS